MPQDEIMTEVGAIRDAYAERPQRAASEEMQRRTLPRASGEAPKSAL